MKRWICARRVISGSPDKYRKALIEAPQGLLQQATGMAPTAPAGDGSFDIEVSARVAGATLHQLVRVKVGEANTRGPRLSVPLTWRATPVRSFHPKFDGAIELQALSAGTAEVSLVGHYDPPLGAVGEVGDTLLPSGVAEGSAQTLVDGLVRALVQHVYDEAPANRTHPGALRVRQVMSSEPLLSFTEDQSLRAAALLLVLVGVSGAPVLDGDGHLIGVLSARDLLDKAADPPTGLGGKALRADERYHATTVGEACTKPARTTSADTPVRAAALEMADRDIDRLVVLDGAQVVGIITRTDALHGLIRADDDIADGVREALAAVGHYGMTVSVVSGVVKLAGSSRLRSSYLDALEVAEAIDGVMAVDHDDLAWEVDDVAPMMPML